MVAVTDSLKNALLSSKQKDLKLTFSDGTVITNDNISYESMRIEQTLCDEEHLTFGHCSATEFTIQLLETQKQFKNLEFKAEITCDGETFNLGTYKVYTDDLTSDRAYKNIVAYDKLFWAFNTDVSAWYNALKFPISQKDFRDSLFAYLGIEQEEVTLINDNLIIDKTIDTTSLTGLVVLENLCEINACFGYMTYDNKFRYFVFEPEYIFPSETLFPSPNLYPYGKFNTTDLVSEDYFLSGFSYADYETEFIECVNIREDSEDIGVTVGKNGNTYVIESNILLYGASVETLTEVANRFLNKVKIISYTPAKMLCKGRPWLEIGDIISVNGMLIPILTRSMSGITALTDTFQAKGKETYGEDANGIYNEIKQLQGKTARIVRTTDGLALEVASKVGENEVVSTINLSDEKIELTGNRLIVNSDNFKVSEDGTIEANNGKFNGEINSTNATITGGSVIIDNGEEYKKSSLVVKASSMGLDTEVSAYGLKVSSDNTGDFSQVEAGYIWLGKIENNTPVPYTRIYSGSVWTESVYTSIEIISGGNLRVLGTTTLASSPVIDSDRDLKKEIKELDAEKSSEFIYSLKPCEYKYINGTSDRFHHGFIAQEVKESMSDDWGVYVDTGEHKALRYEEIIADLVATVKSQNERIKMLEERMGK